MKHYREKRDAERSPADEERFTRKLYTEIDRAASRELKRLSAEDHVLSTCREGCFFCCGQHIVMTALESRALVRHIRKWFTRKQIGVLKGKTRRWHDWNRLRGDALLTASRMPQTGFSLPPHYCPLLVDGKCSAYAMRPVACRTHYVSSSPPACRSRYDAAYSGTAAEKLYNVITVTNPILEKKGQRRAFVKTDSAQALLLLPQWLAIDMHWDFAVD